MRWLHEKSKQVCGSEFEWKALVGIVPPPAALAFGCFAAEGSVSFLVPREALHFMPRQRVPEMYRVGKPLHSESPSSLISFKFNF